jgi:hypothetical protein
MSSCVGGEGVDIGKEVVESGVKYGVEAEAGFPAEIEPVVSGVVAL